MKAELSLDDWVGDVGLFWGLGDASYTADGRVRLCYVMTIERFHKDKPTQLVLSRMTVGDWVSGIRYISNKSILATKEIDPPSGATILFEVDASETGISVRLNGMPAWSSVRMNPVTAKAMTSSKGLVGFIGRGKTVVFRDAAAMFLSLE